MRAAPLTTDRLVLREPVAADAPVLQAYYRANAARFAPWEPRRPDDLAEHARWIAWRRDDGAAGRALSVLAFDRAEPALLRAVIALDAISRQPAREAMLSYTVDGAVEGRGYAREAVTATIAHAFGPLGLDRLSAHYDPENARSAGLLRRLGFTIVATTPAMPALGMMRGQVMAMLFAAAPVAPAE